MPQLFKEALDSYNNFAFGNPKLVDLKKNIEVKNK